MPRRIDPENSFLYRLAHHMIIDKKEIDSLEKITPYQRLNEKLIIAIENKIKTHTVVNRSSKLYAKMSRTTSQSSLSPLVVKLTLMSGFYREN